MLKDRSTGPGNAAGQSSRASDSAPRMFQNEHLGQRFVAEQALHELSRAEVNRLGNDDHVRRHGDDAL